MAEDLINLFETTLAADISSGATSMQLTATGGPAGTLGTAGAWRFVLGRDTASPEIVWGSARSGSTVTISRHEEGTSAAAWMAGTKVTLALTREALMRFVREQPRKAVINFAEEYGAVRSTTATGHSANMTAFGNLISELSAHTTRDGIRTIDFGPSSGGWYWLSDTIGLTDLEDVEFLFPWSNAFNGDLSADHGGGFVIDSVGADTYAFEVNAGGAYTIQTGLKWRGSWNIAAPSDDHGRGVLVDGVNNWGGGSAEVAATNRGGTPKRLRRLITVDRSASDNAHGSCAVFSGGCTEAAIYAIKGGFNVPYGNVSGASGEDYGVFIGPAASEMKLGPAFKVDGAMTVGVMCQGSHCDLLGQYEMHGSVTCCIIDRASNSGDCGRFNTLGGNFVGDGSPRAWIVRNTGGGSMGGNKLAMPTYSNVANQAKTQDATVLPNGVGVFDCGMDYYRLIVSGAYV